MYIVANIRFHKHFKLKNKLNITKSILIKSNLKHLSYSITICECILQDSNIVLEMEEEEILQNGIQLLTHPKDLKKVNIIHDGACLVISMTLFHEFPFKLKLNLVEGSKELVSLYIYNLKNKSISACDHI